MKKIYSLSMALLMCTASAVAATITIKPQSAKTPEFSLGNVLAPETTMLKKAPAQAESATATMALGYGTQIYSANGINGLTGSVGCGIGFTKSQIADYAGNQVVAVNVPSPVNLKNYQTTNKTTMTECTVYLMESENGKPLCETKASLSDEGFAWNKVTLSTPYDITGNTPLYVGVVWEELPDPASDLPFIIDGYANDSDLSFQVYSICTGEVTSDGNLVTTPTPQWAKFADLFGTNLCMTIDVVGDNLPTDKANIFADYHLPSVKPGEPFYYELGVLNCASNPITNIEIKMDIQGQESQFKTVNIVNMADGSPEIAFNQQGVAAAEFNITNEGYNIPYTVSITKVNGQPNNLENSHSGTLLSVKEGYLQNVVLEEFTSGRCVFCPQGIVGIQEAKKAYPDRFIPIAVHCPVPQADQMNVCQSAGPYYPLYSAVSNANGGVSAPSGVINRNIYDVISPTAEDLLQIMGNYEDVYTIAEVKGSVAKVAGDDNKLTLNVTVTPALDVEDNFGVAYTLIENNVGPYSQSNAFAGGQYGTCGGWENMPNPVEKYYFNEVARRGTEFNPLESTYMSSLTKGESKSFELTMNTKYLTDKDNSAVVAMLIHRSSGTIVNACQIEFANFVGIDSIAADAKKAIAFGLKGAIDMQTAGNIYTIDGRMVAAKAEGTVSLPAGIYIVATPAGNAKVIVR